MAQKLSGDARSRALARLHGWSEVSGRDAISKKFVFADFNEAFGFMASGGRCGSLAGMVNPNMTRPICGYASPRYRPRKQSLD